MKRYVNSTLVLWVRIGIAVLLTERHSVEVKLASSYISRVEDVCEPYPQKDII